jgi:hypothetical protein
MQPTDQRTPQRPKRQGEAKKGSNASKAIDGEGNRPSCRRTTGASAARWRIHEMCETADGEVIEQFRLCAPNPRHVCEKILALPAVLEQSIHRLEELDGLRRDTSVDVETGTVHERSVREVS